LFILLFIVISVSSCSKRPQEEQSKTKEQIEIPLTPAETPPPSTNQVAEKEFSPVEHQIYEFMQLLSDDYERIYGVEKGEALVSIAASKEFKRTIIEVCRIYDLVQNSKSGNHLTDAEIDALNMRRFRDIGFVVRDSVWYFDDQVVNMGNPLPTPESMKPKQPDEAKKLEVTMETEVVISDLKTLQIKGKTNLPDETEVMIHLSCPEMNYSAGDKAVVMNGQFESSSFSDAKRPLHRLGDGQYVVEISTPTVDVLDASVKKVLGEGGRNMTGKLIVFDEVLGNRMICSKTINVQ